MKWTQHIDICFNKLRKSVNPLFVLMVQQRYNSLVRINTISVMMDRQSLIWLVDRESLSL